MAFLKALVQYVTESDDSAVQGNHWRNKSHSTNEQQNTWPINKSCARKLKTISKQYLRYLCNSNIVTRMLFDDTDEVL